MKIQKTKDYNLFFLLPENRPVDMKRVISMEKWCIENDTNFLENFPILVNSQIQPGMFAIIDGQHRAKLSERLTEPVYYIINNTVKTEDMIPVNTHQKNWHVKDYLNFYAKKGNLTYVQLQKISDANPEIPITTLYAMYAATPNGMAEKSSQKFKSGEMLITNFSKGTKTLEILKDFKPIFKDWKNKYFIMAVVEMALSPNYNHRVMMSKLAYLQTRLVRCPDSKSYLALLEEIYNFKNRDRISLKR